MTSAASVEPVAALKIGRYSCFCMWVPAYSGIPQEDADGQGGGGLPLPRRLRQLIDWIGGISLPALEKRRAAVLPLLGMMSLAGLLLSIISLVGGFSDGETLAHLSWVNIVGHAGKQEYTGIRYLCVRHAEHDDFSLNCTQWSDMNCDAPQENCTTLDVRCHTHNMHLSIQRAQCDECKHHSVILFVPLIFATVMYLTLVRGTFERYRGRDTAFNKCSILGGGVAGGISQMYLVANFFLTCIYSTWKNETFKEVSFGPGFALMTVATWLKIAVGLLHLGLAATTAR